MEKSDFTRELVARRVGSCVKVGVSSYADSTWWDWESIVDIYLC